MGASFGAPLSLIMSNKIDQLLASIKAHNEAYRAGNPVISDAEYDKEMDELRALDPENDWFKHTEPATVGKGRKVKLPHPMKSLNKAKSLNEVKQWMKSLALPETAKLVINPKFDGISWLHDERTGATYSRGGADNEGQICTQHYLKGNFDKKNPWGNEQLSPEFTFGELVFSRASWEANFVGQVSDATGEPYRSPRNTVAGFINRDDASDKIRFLQFFRYGIGEGDLGNFSTYEALYRELCDVFNQPYLGKTITVNELDDAMLMELFQEWRKLYYIDGLVIYLNDLNLWDTIGRQQTTGNPLYAIAYKHPDFTDVFETTVKGVDWKISKAGALKPVVNIEAVNTGDCTMECPTGYNAKYIFENGIGKGAKITVTRSGGVIPKILNVLEEADSDTMIEQRDELLYCPDCGQPTKWNDTQVELICTNSDCPGIRLAKIIHFYNILEAEQLGEETITKLFKAGYDSIRRILDITFDELLLIDTFGEVIANAILDANKKIREGVELTKLMHASDCFQGIGQVKAKSILLELSESDRFAFVNGLVRTNEGFDQTPEFLALNKTLQSFLKGIVPFYDFIATNKLVMLPMEEPAKPIGDKYQGFKVCFTGVRDKELEAEIAAQGGEVVSSVSKKTTHLIVADLNTTSGKAEKAKALGIPIFTIESFKTI
jgi:NAD-dependent DNA ligase